MTVNEKVQLIIGDIQLETSTSPARIFENIAAHDYVSMHGPEHHVLDGACLLTAYRNAGGVIDLPTALEKLMAEGLRMPGAMCGLWGVCGAVTSLGAALAILDGTGPLSADGSWGQHMVFTSSAVRELGRIDGPRCCKRDGKRSLELAVDYVNEHYPVHLTHEVFPCRYASVNAQCIRERCPYYSE